MRLFSKRLILLLALSLGLSQATLASGPDRDRDRDQGSSSSAPVTAYSHGGGGGPEPGNCSLGGAERDLDVNNTLARVFNTGSLFFGNTTTNGKGYLVPQASGLAPIFASGIWIGGKVNGEIQVAGARYTRYEFWPGPLNDDGTLPTADCRAQNAAGREIYDRIYKVSRTDIQAFESGGSATVDLIDWPAALGAPVIAAVGNGIDDDGDGLIDEGSDGISNDDDNGDGIICGGLEPCAEGVDPDFVDERDEQERRIDGGYDLAAGDRPEIVGDQGLWWVMNDVGNVHQETGSDPLGVEVQVLAWSFARADALGETTFYRYRVINKSGIPITESYLSVFSDPDLGDATDDWVGSDIDLSLGYVYNGDDFDDPSANGYGVPPAAGYDFFQGPIVDLDGDGERTDTLGLTAFTYFCNGCPQPATVDPRTKEEYYNHMQGLWKDGVPFTAAGDGYQTEGEVTKFVFPGDPVTGECWSMANDCLGGSVNPNDQRLIVHTGPFTMEPGVPQDIVFGIVFAQGGDNLSSVSALRAADQIAQAAYDADFEIAPPPPAPPLCNDNNFNADGTEITSDNTGTGNCLEAFERDGEVTLVWGYPPSSPNYLGQFSVLNRLLPADSGDLTYDFEGFNIYRYPNSGFPEDQRVLVATYDIANGVTLVRDERFDPAVGVNVPFIAARGTDTGIQYYHDIEGLTNYTDYYYGITAYAYIDNDLATGSRISESQPTQITIRPSQVAAGNGGQFVQSELGDVITATRIEGGGAGNLLVRVIDPSAVRDATYTVRFYTFQSETEGELTTFDVLRDGEVILNGQQQYETSGILPGGAGAAYAGVDDSQNVIIDGLEFFTSQADAENVPEEDADGVPDFSGDGQGIVEVAYGTQGATCPDPNKADDWGCTMLDGAPGNTVFLNGNVNDDYFVTGAGSSGDFQATATRLRRYVFQTAPERYEMRFTAEGGYAIYGFVVGGLPIARVPFEIWNIGLDVDDPSDDVRMIPFLNPDTGNNPITNFANTFQNTDGWNGLGPDGEPTGLPTGLPMTEWVYWMMPDRPNGYDLFEADAIAFGGPGAQYDPSADNDDQIDPDPFNGGDCANQGAYIDYCYRNYEIATPSYPADGGQGATFVYPIGRFGIVDLAGDGTTPPTGTVIRIYTTPFPAVAAGDTFEFSTSDLALVTDDAMTAEEALDLIGIVPNPYMGSSAYETGNLSRVVRFTNLPEVATIRIYTVAGTLVKTLTKEGPSRSLDWNLQTEGNLPVASGMYLIHVDVPGVGERVLKFGVVQRRTRITVF